MLLIWRIVVELLGGDLGNGVVLGDVLAHVVIVEEYDSDDGEFLT